MFNWNFLGVLAWIIVIAWVMFIIYDIRRRHLKMVAKDKKTFTWQNFFVDGIEVIILLVGFTWLTHLTFFNQVDLGDKDNIAIKYQYEPLVIQTSKGEGYYVSIKHNKSETEADTYTYYVQDAKYSVSSKDSMIVDTDKIISYKFNNYPWNEKKMKKLDKTYSKAYVTTLKAKYKNTPSNGLGMRVGQTATEYRVIRVPSPYLVKNRK